MKVRSKIWLEKDGQLVFGTGKSLILKAIHEAGSINKAAKKMNMSYRHAWSYIHFAEKRLVRDLLIKTKGGQFGGGAILTDFARDLLKKFEKLEQEVEVFVSKRYQEIFHE